MWQDAREWVENVAELVNTVFGLGTWWSTILFSVFLSTAPSLFFGLYLLILVAWIITAIGAALEASEISAASVFEPVAVGLGWVFVLVLVGGAGYGIYRGLPYLWSSTVAWWRWLGGHVLGH